MTDTTFAGGQFQIGTCLKRALSTFFANFIAFNLLGFTVMVPGLILLIALFSAVFAGLFLSLQSGNAPPSGLGALHFGTFGLIWVMAVTLQYFLTGVIVYGALRYLQGEKAGYAACLGRGFRRFVPIVAVAVVSTVLITIGTALVIVPGIIIALMICLAVPVLMVESPGILGSLSRSRELTKGYRWHLFGLFLIAIVATAVINIIVPLPFELVSSDLATFVGAIIQLFTTVFLAVLLAVAYHDLRVAKEGVSSEQIAAVFD
jgi:hypothetical protein